MSQAEQIAKQLIKCFKRGNKVMIAGNGGSASQASHLAAELIHEGLPAISLSADTSVLTSISNDSAYHEVFARQLIALAKPKDIFIGISTSGKSANILYAYQWAKKLDVQIIDFPRKGKTPRCQEMQLRLLHRVWEYISENI